MAAGKWKLYEEAKLKIARGEIDLENDTIKMALFLSTSNCNTLSGVDQLSDLTNQHANGNGYTTGGQTIQNQSTSNSSGTITFDFDNMVWTASGGPITARFAVLYDDDEANDQPIAVCLLDTSPADVEATDGNEFRININASGAFTLSGAASD